MNIVKQAHYFNNKTKTPTGLKSIKSDLHGFSGFHSQNFAFIISSACFPEVWNI